MGIHTTKIRKRLLMVEDEERFYHEMVLGLSAYTLEYAKNLKTAATLLRNQNFDLVLLDLNLNEEKPDEFEGLEYIKTIRDKYPILPIIVMSKHAGLEEVKKALRYGANDYFYKPNRLYEVWRNRIAVLTDEKRTQEEHYPFEGESDHFKQLRLKLKNKADTKEHLLFQGETGVGKTSAAHYYHKISNRTFLPFLNLDIAYYEKEEDVESLFNKIKTGIVYIKAIDSISPRAQAFLFDTITKQKRGGAKADIQFLASTTRDMKELVSDQQFRSDLFFSFSSIEISPLCQRKRDISVLLDFYLRKEANLGLDQLVDNEAKRMLLNYHYPQNVHGLIKIVKHSMSEKGLQQKAKIDRDCLPKEIVFPNQEKTGFGFSEFRKARAYSDLDFVENALRETYGQKGKAAKLLALKPDDMRYMVMKHFNDYPDLFVDFPNVKNGYKL